MTMSAMSLRQESSISKSAAVAVTSSSSGVLQRKCACGMHTMGGGQCAECAKNKSGLQRKLAIGASHDPLDWEADGVADQMIAVPAHFAVSGTPPSNRRNHQRATNMKSALDTAFMRRLRFIVTFPFPGIPERKRIWERAFPKETEKERLDYERLARFNLTGGSIQNIVINAAFSAASAGSPVTMPLIFEAARSEFRKLEKPINEAEFRLMQAVGAKA